MKKNIFILILIYLSNYCNAQTNILPEYIGVTKSVKEILEYQETHPYNFSNRVFENEHDVHFNRIDNPNALPIPNITQPKLSRASQNIFSNFLAIYGGFVGSSESGYVPPDNNGDVGPTQLVVTANGRIKFFAKPLLTGTAITTTTSTSATTATSSFSIVGDQFFATVGGAGSAFSDIHVRYDRLSQRWFMVAIDVTHKKNNYIVIAVSSSSTITNTSSFTFFKFKGNIISSSSNTFQAGTNFFDYPTLGVDKNAIYIGGNDFDSITKNYTGSPFFVVQKSGLLTGTLNVTGFQLGIGATLSGSTVNSGIYTPQGVQNDDPASNQGYFIGVSNNVAGQLVLKRVNNPSTTTPTISSDVTINITNYASPNSVITLGNTASNPIDAGDERILAAMIQKNKITGISSLVVAHGSAVNSAGSSSLSGNRNAARWFQINTYTATPTVAQNGNLFNNAASNPVSFNYPSIAMSGQGHMIMGFTSASANTDLQTSYAGRYRTDANGTLQTLVNATATSANYNAQSAVVQRWGDYTQVTVDPLDNQTMWLFGQYTPSANAWGVRAVQLKAPPPAKPSLAATPICSAAYSLTINGTSSNNSEFFDPGVDLLGPGFNRFSVSINGPSTIGISNTKFINITKATTILNTSTMLAGTYTVIVTNPDGQSDSTTFTNPTTCITIPLNINNINLNAYLQNDSVALNWDVKSIDKIKKFLVQKSIDGGNQFITFDSIAINTKTNNLAYQFKDYNIQTGNLFYRVLSFDENNEINYSNIAKITIKDLPLTIVSAYPNPTDGNLNILLSSDINTNAHLILYNTNGEKLVEQEISIPKGQKTALMDMNRLASGIYILQLINKNGITINNLKIEKK